MDMLFVMDPITGINPKKDTTFAFLLAAQAAGHTPWFCTTGDLGAATLDVWAHARPISRVVDRASDFVELGDEVKKPLRDFDAVWMRKDPPFHSDYLYATLLFDLVDGDGVRVINRPSGLRLANEKAFILQFEEVSPATIITKRADDVRAFMAEHDNRAVLKPLDLMGGAGIFLLHADDPNLNSILEQSTKYGAEFVMIQEFLPAAKEGDKRILLLDGEPLGAILRVPRKGEFRGNLAAGGSAVATEITSEEHAIIERLAPRLREEGLYFVGLDVIGNKLTEVNVTSPTGIREMSTFNGEDIAAKVIDWGARFAGA